MPTLLRHLALLLLVAPAGCSAALFNQRIALSELTFEVASSKAAPSMLRHQPLLAPLPVGWRPAGAGLASAAVARLPRPAQASARLQRTRQADYFQRQGQLTAGMYLRRCTELQADGARDAYRAIAAHYNSTLLDRYPFAASASAPDAEPEQVRYMLRLLDAHYDNVHGWLALQQGDDARNALAFLDRLAAGRVLLTAILQLAPDSGAPAALDLWAEFRINRARESGADQIIAWKVDAGTAAALPGDPIAWRLGAPITLTLRWAKNSAREPAADLERYPGLQVVAKHAIWRYAGPWALLRAMSSHAAAPADAGADTRLPQVLRFTVPTQYSDGKPAADTVAFGRLRITLNGKPERLGLPGFPHAPSPALAPAMKPAATNAASL